MKTIVNVFAAALGALCLTGVSCNKPEEANYSDSYWGGEYPLQMQNGTTGELEEHTGTIVLEFTRSGNGCIVETGVVGLYAVNRVSFEARWSDSASFALYRHAGGQSLLEYSGTIKRDQMLLEALNCDSVAATYALKKIPVKAAE